MATTSKEPSNKKRRRTPNVRMIQNFHLVWLDGSIDEENDDGCRNSITKLQEVVNAVNTFTDVDECIDFITDINEEMTSLIVSGEIIQIIVPIVQQIPQVNSVYIFGENEPQYAKWAKEYFKVKGVITNITTICEALKQDVQEYDHNSISVSFVKLTDTTLNQNLDTLDPSFMYTQILKEILLTIDFEQSHFYEFLTSCREELVGNPVQLANIARIEKDYHQHQPIWWYSYESLLYSMVNRALRLMEVNRIIKMGFFIRDLHTQIAELHAEQFSGQNRLDSFIVYRGQGLSHTVFDQLKKTQGGLMSFNNFLSTSFDRAVSVAFAASSADNPNLTGVLFEISINPSISSSPFANITNLSHYREEKEILFSMHSVFRIGQVQQIEGNNRLYQVNLTLTSDNDPQLHALTKRIQKETSSKYKGWHRLGKLMVQIGQFNEVEDLYNVLLQKTNDEGEQADLYHLLGRVKNEQGNYAESVKFYEKAIEICEKTLPENNSGLASYVSIGVVFHNMGKYSRALSYYEKALEINQKIHALERPSSAICYNNIGLAYENMEEYPKALHHHEIALEIWQQTLPANHPCFATCYNNIGLVCDKMGKYAEALSSYEKALEIRQKVLPVNHPDFAQAYNNIGLVYGNMEKYSKALSYYEKAHEIWQQTLSANHPNFGSCYNNIAAVYYKMGEYSEAVLYYKKALEIDRKTVPVNHLNLGDCYLSIGVIYYTMGEYPKALSYCENALDIQQRSLPLDHPDVENVKRYIEIIKKKI